MKLNAADWQIAGYFSLLSASTFPLGALLGILSAAYGITLSRRVLSFLLAFGGGALIFAVTIELYAEGLHDVEKKGVPSTTVSYIVSLASAVVGALLFVFLEGRVNYVRRRTIEKCHDKQDDISSSDDEIIMPVSSPVPPKTSLLSQEDNKNFENQKKKEDADIDTEGKALPSKKESIHVVETDPRLPLLPPSPSGGGSRKKTRKFSKAWPKWLYTDRLVTLATRKIYKSSIPQPSSSLQLLSIAFAMWVGQLLDAVPEAMLIGFRTVSDHLSWAFILSILISNFPEAFAGGYIMKKEGMRSSLTAFLWLLVALITGGIATLTAAFSPSSGKLLFEPHLTLKVVSAVVQGIAGGAMLALVSASMLPAAFESGGTSSGVFCVLGFLASVSLRLFSGILEGADDAMPGREGGLIHNAHKTNSSAFTEFLFN